MLGLCSCMEVVLRGHLPQQHSTCQHLPVLSHSGLFQMRSFYQSTPFAFMAQVGGTSSCTHVNLFEGLSAAVHAQP